MNDLPNAVSTPAGAVGETRVRSLTGVLPMLANGWLWALMVVGSCWMLLFGELSQEWRINAQYSYGYVVPFLGLALLWRRCSERPAPRPGSSWSAPWAVAFLLLLLPAIRLVLQANPEWRLLYWVHGLQAVSLSLCLFYWAGGRAWVAFFAFPLVFMLVAVPWPMGLEQGAVQDLMRQVAGLTVTVADWLGIPAVQHGNLIETTAGVVGIDEACSGIRSLQSALMLSLFLGEMHRLNISRRLALVGASLVLDLLANVARTSFLVWAAANRGITQMEAWHDAAGTMVMIIILPTLLVLALWIKPRAGKGMKADSNPDFVQEDKTAPRSDSMRPNLTAGRLRPIPQWAGLLGLAWLGLGEVGSEAWYRLHETRLVDNIRWSVAWPGQSSHFRKTAVPERALAILRCSQSEAASWEDEAGHPWNVFLLRWDAGKNSAQLAKGHQPDICFPAAGARLLDDFGLVSIPIHGFVIPFHHQTFDTGSTVVHVFYCLWPDRIAPEEKPVLEDGSQLSRLMAVLAGKRHLGQQVLEIVISGIESRSQAVQALRDGLPGLICREPMK